MLKLRDLAVRPDLTVGPLSVSPSRRLVSGPGGEVSVEPLIMQVFLLLLEARGRVVTRDELFEQCWGGVMVGDDSLNRAIARVRRIEADVAPGSFEIETIPRTGYRLTGAIADSPLTQSELPEDGSARTSRRNVILGASAALAAASIGGFAWYRSNDDRRTDALVARAQAMIDSNSNFADPAAIPVLQQALALRPRDARANGLLALVSSLNAQTMTADRAPRLVAQAERSARNALAIDPKEPNALMAMFELQGSTIDWMTRDRRLREIIAADPRHMIAIIELVALLQSAGLNRESWDWNEKALQIQPLSSMLLSRRALKLWIAGKTLAADKVLDQVRDLYPGEGFSAWVRFLILALTDRVQAASSLLDEMPDLIGSRPMVEMWRKSLPALESRTAADIAQARAACTDASTRAGEMAAHAVMIMSALGEVDAAFNIATGFLLWRGGVVRKGDPANGMMNDSQWRISTQWLFTPSCAAMRSDPRFLPLCNDIGLGDYWRARGVKPDYLAA